MIDAYIHATSPSYGYQRGLTYFRFSVAIGRMCCKATFVTGGRLAYSRSYCAAVISEQQSHLLTRSQAVARIADRTASQQTIY